MEPMKKIVELKVDARGESAPLKKSPSKPKSVLNSRFLLTYVIILMGVAVLFVFLSYLSHLQRQSNLGWEELERQNQLSVSALESVEFLQKENARLTTQSAEINEEAKALRMENERLRRQIADINEQSAQAQSQHETALSESLAEKLFLQKQALALESLWRAERLVALRRYTAARELMTASEEVSAYLPTQADERFSDAASSSEEWSRLADALN